MMQVDPDNWESFSSGQTIRRRSVTWPFLFFPKVKNPGKLKKNWSNRKRGGEMPTRVMGGMQG